MNYKTLDVLFSEVPLTFLLLYAWMILSLP